MNAYLSISPDGEELQTVDSLRMQSGHSLPCVTLIGTFSESKHNEHFSSSTFSIQHLFLKYVCFISTCKIMQTYLYLHCIWFCSKHKEMDLKFLGNGLKHIRLKMNTLQKICCSNFGSQPFWLQGPPTIHFTTIFVVDNF